MSIPFKQHDTSTLDIFIKVTPKSSNNKIGGLIEGSDSKIFLKVFVTTVPEQGKANEAVIHLLAKALKLSKSQITIVSGHTAHLKTLRLTHLNPEDIKRITEITQHGK